MILKNAHTNSIVGKNNIRNWCNYWSILPPSAFALYCYCSLVEQERHWQDIYFIRATKNWLSIIGRKYRCSTHLTSTQYKSTTPLRNQTRRDGVTSSYRWCRNDTNLQRKGDVIIIENVSDFVLI